MSVVGTWLIEIQSTEVFHTHYMHLHLFSLRSCAASVLWLFACLVCVPTWLGWRGCEIPGIKRVQISREMDKRVWRIKLCDVTSGVGRRPRLLIELSGGKTLHTGACGLNTGLNPSQATARNPQKLAPPPFPLFSSCAFPLWIFQNER